MIDMLALHRQLVPYFRSFSFLYILMQYTGTVNDLRRSIYQYIADTTIFLLQDQSWRMPVQATTATLGVHCYKPSVLQATLFMISIAKHDVGSADRGFKQVQ
jgi:hypothetical protein